jgi:photosynthetic reaction center H subunit
MHAGINGYIDVAQLVLYGFWIFFAGLIYYLHQENKREGYPLESDRSGGRIIVQGFPPIPSAKTYLLPHGGTSTAPNGKADTRTIHAKPIGPWLGAPLEPTGDPMVDGVGPAAWAERADVPDLTYEGEPKIVPLRADGHFSLASEDPDPRGMDVVGDDGRVAGTVCDVWVDRSEVLVRYFEVALKDSQRTVLLPFNMSRVDGGRRQVNVKSIHARHFANVPALRNPEQVTLLEEDKIMGYYAGGHLYATPFRQEPLL